MATKFTVPSIPGIPTLPSLDAGAATSTFNPATDPRVAAWYNESSVQVTDGVDVWEDATANNNDLSLVLGDGGEKPGYLTEDSEINNHNSVTFAGQGEALRRTSAPSGITTAATLAFVGRKDGVSQAGFYAQGFASGNHHPFSDTVVYDGLFSSTRQTCGTPSPATEGAYHIWIIHAENSNYRVEIDGVQLFSTSTYTFNAGSRFTLGGGSDSGAVISFRLSGRLAEVILLNAVLSSGDRAAVRSYFETKFAL